MSACFLACTFFDTQPFDQLPRILVHPAPRHTTGAWDIAWNPILRPKEHFVDQHGYTDQLFGLCHLLGYSLMPRLPVSKQTLYKLDRTKHYGRLDAIFQGTIDVGLIREQWDQLVRVAASLRNRTAPAHI